MKNQLLLGITGAFGSGKTTASDYLISKDFSKITLSSFLEKEAKRRGIDKITRVVLQEIGNEWRREYGKGVLGKKALKHINEEKISKVVVDGIRNLGEVEELKKNKNFFLLAIVADRQIRYNRAAQNKARESLTPQLFERLDRKDMGLGEDEAGLQVAYCVGVADYYIENNTTQAEFMNRLEDLLLKLL